MVRQTIDENNDYGRNDFPQGESTWIVVRPDTLRKLERFY